MPGILTITLNPALDISSETETVQANVKIRCKTPRRDPGGGGVNVSRAIAFLGGESRVAVAAGGETGATLLRLLKEDGLTPIDLRVSNPTRETLNIMEISSGHQYRFLLPGPSWTREDCDTALDTIKSSIADGDILIPSGSYPPGVPEDFFVTLNRELRSRGTKMVFDTSGAALAAAANAASDMFLLRMNSIEASELAGRPLKTINDLADVATSLIESHAATHVAIASGARGTVVASGDHCWHCRPPQVEVRSKVGAGDSFVGGFTLALSQGRSVIDACTYGVAAATSAVTTPDTKLCEPEQTKEYEKRVTVTQIRGEATHS